MASRNYGMAYDTPYNERLLSILEKYDRERDTNGEPDYFHETMEGGAYLGPDGQVHTSKSLRLHPHLSHPLMGAMSREMGGGFNLGKAFKSVGRTLAPVGRALAPVGRAVGQAGMDVARDVGKYALQEGQRTATSKGKEYVDAYLSGMGVMSGGLRPPGMVSPFVHSVTPGHMVAPGTMSSYPVYNAVEMRAMNGGQCCGCAGMCGGMAKPVEVVKEVVEVLKKRGRPKKGGFGLKDVGKAMKKVGKFATSPEALPLELMLVGAGKKRGRPKKGGFSMKDVGKALGSVGKSVGSVALDVGKNVATEMAKDAIKSYAMGATKSGKGMEGVGVMKKGAGVKSGGVDGRKARAEIVKKIMKEKGLKMVDASKYVKEHGLYKK